MSEITSHNMAKWFYSENSQEWVFNDLNHYAMDAQEERTLSLAVATNNITEVQRLVAAGANVNEQV